MRIYDTPQNLSTVSAGQTRRADPATSGKLSGKAGVESHRSDEVQLSELASGNTAGADATSREERVAGLAALYQRGSYAVDAEAVAGNMIDDSTVMP